MKAQYRDWLIAEGYAENTCVAQIHRVQKVEAHYGSLDEAFDLGKLEDVLASLSYSTSDERSDKENPSRIPINGNLRNGLQSYKNAVQRYARFLREIQAGSSLTAANERLETTGQTKPERQRFTLERDMQTAIRQKISLLDTGFEIVDDGAERAVASGFIDILCRGADGSLVVVELKAGKTDSKVVAQTLGYMGDLVEEGEEAVRGIIVAHEFDRRTISASKAVPNLTLVRYSVSFAFEALS
ncbi:endonuclease NucS [Ruegeria marisrubri]|uniref:endonuclease NucS domain-containing protein n=1 Tax=Ruegeria marisrubri TaxID=1685379 RepID=UPI001CD23A2D|nr:endonuclease NucS domain-containing protein [Ruegeria marisrubri]MCA0905933.1 endonuclease NucS [Ruegeria marisrubri]